MTDDSLTPERIDELLRFMPEVIKSTDPQAKWEGGDQDDAAGHFSMPYPVYSPLIREFFEVASQPWWCDTNYQSSGAANLIEDDNAIANASLDQIKALITYCVRGERFCDGHWASMIQQGRITAILHRLEQLRNSEDHP